MGEAVVQPDDEPLFEIVNGARVELPPMSVNASILASRLLCHLHDFSRRGAKGEAVMQTLFHLALPVDRNRRPDVAFVSYERWPKGKPQSWHGNAWDVVPDLAVEVISPSDLAYEILVKMDAYFRAGVRLVWVIYPHLRVIYVHDSFMSVRILGHTDVLDGGAVLPKFQLPLVELFTEELVE